jgi:hypothetical protein
VDAEMVLWMQRWLCERISVVLWRHHGGVEYA